MTADFIITSTPQRGHFDRAEYQAVKVLTPGGIGTILVVSAVAWYWPEIRKYGRLDGA